MSFEVKAVDPNVDNIGKGFDLICAFEFYPFTRTKKVDDHRKYLNHLLDSLMDNGKLVIFQLWDNENSLSSTYYEIKKEFKEFKFSEFLMPIRLVGVYVPVYSLALKLSFVFRPLLRKLSGRQIGRNKCIIIITI